MTSETPDENPKPEPQIEESEIIFDTVSLSSVSNDSFSPAIVEENINKKNNNIVGFTEESLSEEEKIILDKNLDIEREGTRSRLATTLIWIFGLTYFFTIVVMSFVMFMPVNDKEQRTERYNYSKDVFSLLMSTQTGIIGAVLGFYFGSNRNKNS